MKLSKKQRQEVFAMANCQDRVWEEMLAGSLDTEK
jgi:hypothetical protein